MIFDVVFLILILAFMFCGIKKGFFHTFIHTAGWIIAIIGSVFITPWLKEPLMETALYRSIGASISSGLGTTTSEFGAILEIMPENIVNSVTNITDSLLGGIVMNVSELAVIIFTFLALIIVIKLVLLLILKLLSLESHKPVGFIDKAFGMIIGLGKGVLIVLLILTLMVPLLSIANPETATSILKIMDGSIVTKEIFNNNILVQILGNFLI